MNQKLMTPLDSILKYWQLVVVIAMALIGYGKFQTEQQDQNLKISNVQAQILTANAEIATANLNSAKESGDIETINGKLDLLINHSGLIYGK